MCFFRRDIAAVLVEVHLAILLAHIHFEFFGGAASLVTVIRIAHTVQSLGEAERETFSRSESNEEKSLKRA